MLSLKYEVSFFSSNLSLPRSAASVAANVVNNANSNNNNNNNNNNDNNDNIFNLNVANNNNAGNNFNDIQICPFPCVPGPPPIITSKTGGLRGQGNIGQITKKLELFFSPTRAPLK